MDVVIEVADDGPVPVTRWVEASDGRTRFEIPSPGDCLGPDPSAVSSCDCAERQVQRAPTRRVKADGMPWREWINPIRGPRSRAGTRPAGVLSVGVRVIVRAPASSAGGLYSWGA